MSDSTLRASIIFFYGDGYVLRWLPSNQAANTIATTDTTFQDGPVDEFGIPPHSHSDAVFAEFDGDFTDLVLKAAKDHGPPKTMSAAMLRRVGRFEVALYQPPVSFGKAGYMVVALAPQEPQSELSKEEVVRLGKTKGSLPIPEHVHWFLGEEPVPLSTALWAFRSITEENLDATDCNCGKGTPFGGPGLRSPFTAGSAADEDEEDERYIGMGEVS